MLWDGLQCVIMVFPYIARLLYNYLQCSEAISKGAMGLAAVCYSGISWSYSLTF